MADVELIISANGCVDNTRDYLHSIHNKIKLIWSDEPIGFTKATNNAILASTGDYVILLNNDTLLLEQNKSDWLRLLEQPFLDDDTTGISGPALMNHLGLMERTGMISRAVVFYCAMIKRSVINKIGLLDEAYSPGGVEDHDYSMRAELAGFSLKHVNVPIVHLENQTFKEPSINYLKILHRNEDYYVNKFKPKNDMKYSIVIPTYNHCDDLLKPCIEAICNYTNMGSVELIISANGCVDNTREYLSSLAEKFRVLGFEKNLKVVWSDAPTGYAKATNDGIEVSTADKIILLNNDAFLLPQEKDTWLNMFMKPFIEDPQCGISAPLTGFSEPAGRDFAIFFAVMIDRKVFDKIGLLNEIYGKGGGEDTEFCIEAENAGFKVILCDILEWSEDIMLHVGEFPIYHRGEATVHDKNLVPDWDDVFLQNSLTLAKKYNPEWYIKEMKLRGIQDVSKILGWLSGSNDEANEIYNEVVVQNTYNLSNADVAGKTVIDIGANIGVFSILAAALGAKNILSVEPVRSTYETFNKNIKLSGFDTVIKTFKNVVSDVKDDVIKISLCNQSGHNSIYNVEDSYEEVSSITLSDLLSKTDDNDIFLKMDCEGSEFDIILGATDEEMNRISKIVLEVHTDLHPIYKDLTELHQKMNEFGFKLLDEKQMCIWDYDENGDLVNCRKMPLRTEIWSK